MLTPRLLTLTLASATAAAMLSVPATAATVDFEDPAYTVGTSISGKADPNFNDTWAGGLGSTVGFDGTAASPTNRFYQTPTADSDDSGSSLGNNRIFPDAAALGGSNAASGTYEYSFGVRAESAQTSFSDFAPVADIRIAQASNGSQTTRFLLYSNGLIQVLGDGVDFFATTTGNPADGGSRFDLDDSTDRFVTISGTLDYDNDQFTVSVDGVAQNNGNPLTFRSGSGATYDDVGAVWIEAQNQAQYRSYQVDDISLAIPEPASLGLLGLGGLLLAARPHRR
jgi:hypothetical protein